MLELSMQPQSLVADERSSAQLTDAARRVFQADVAHVRRELAAGLRGVTVTIDWVTQFKLLRSYGILR